MLSIDPCCGVCPRKAVAFIGGIKLVSAAGMIVAGIKFEDYLSVVVGAIHIINDVTSMCGALRESLRIIKSSCFSYILLFVLSMIAHIMLISETWKVTRTVIIIWATLDALLSLYSFWVMYACINEMNEKGEGKGKERPKGESSNPQRPDFPPPPAPETDIAVPNGNYTA